MSNKRAHGEAGAALQLALIFLTAIALIVGALISFAGESSQATVITRATRGTDYDADATMQAAIAIVRVGSCATPTPISPALVLNNPLRPLHVDCTQPFGAFAARRRVVLSVCPDTDTAVPCDAAAILRAEVTFYDDPPGRAVSIQSWSN